MFGVDGIGRRRFERLQDAYLASYPSHKQSVFILTKICAQPLSVDVDSFIAALCKPILIQLSTTRGSEASCEDLGGRSLRAKIGDVLQQRHPVGSSENKPAWRPQACF